MLKQAGTRTHIRTHAPKKGKNKRDIVVFVSSPEQREFVRETWMQGSGEKAFKGFCLIKGSPGAKSIQCESLCLGSVCWVIEKEVSYCSGADWAFQKRS